VKHEIDHIGIAVESIDESVKFYQSIGWDDIATEIVDKDGVKVAFLPLANQANIELIEPIREDSPVRKFLNKNGQGLHHICMRVDDIHKTLQDMKNAGVRLIDETPRKGAHGKWVAFVHPKSTGGVLLELSQAAGGAE
jgi:methylmalonyl-CoA/ethylmalonyl-CoA epimerase